MIELAGQPAELRFTLEIKRAATGKTETYAMVGHINPTPQPQPEETTQEEDTK